MAKFKYDFNPFEMTGVKVPRGTKDEALEAVRDFVRESMLTYIADGSSPVKGGKWKRELSEAYAEEKAEESGVDYANLELKGDLLDEFSNSFQVNGNRISFGISDPENTGKAEGHLTGIYGKSKKVKKRQFMPVGDEELKGDIMRGVKQILEEYAEED